MFIFAFIVGEEQDRSHPLIPYPLKFRLRPEAYLKLSPILLHHLIGTLPGDVTSPQLLQGLSLNLLYFD